MDDAVGRETQKEMKGKRLRKSAISFHNLISSTNLTVP
jgi:hypothetical protein